MKIKQRIFIFTLIAVIIPGYAFSFICTANKVTANQHVWSYPGELALTSNGRWLVVLDINGHAANIVDTAVHKTHHSIELGFEPGGLVITEENQLFISNAFEGSVSIYDISSSTPENWPLVGKITAGKEDETALGRMIYDESKNILYAADDKAKLIRVISVSELKETGHLDFPESQCRTFSDLELSGDKLFVACEVNNTVAVFNTETLIHETYIPVSRSPVSLLADPLNKRLFAACASQSVVIINTEDLSVFRTDKSENNEISLPIDMAWLDNTIWISDRTTGLVNYNPDSTDNDEKFILPDCAGIGSWPSYMTVGQDQERNDIIYIAYSEGVNYVKIEPPCEKRLYPQVIMAGFDPMLIDINEKELKVMAVVLEGINELSSVSLSQNLSDLNFAMTPRGTIDLEIQGGKKVSAIVYEAVIPFFEPLPAGQISTMFGLPTYSMFGGIDHQFRITAFDEFKLKHDYPFWHWGQYPSTEVDSCSQIALSPYDDIGGRKAIPQVIMAGFSPMHMDISDTEMIVLAVVRPGSAPILDVKLNTQGGEGFLWTALTKQSDLPNNDELWGGTVIAQRDEPLFSEEQQIDIQNIWNDLFVVVVRDEAMQEHRFPDLRIGNYPDL